MAEANYRKLKDTGKLGKFTSPTEYYRERRVSLVEINDLIASCDDPAIGSFCHSEVMAIGEVMQEDDEIWQYCSDSHSWDFLAGRAGYKIFRQGKFVDILPSRRS